MIVFSLAWLQVFEMSIFRCVEKNILLIEEGINGSSIREVIKYCFCEIPNNFIYRAVRGRLGLIFYI